MDIIHLLTRFAEEFSAHGRVFGSPGRINIIGEHTDYNRGWVLPAAIDRCLYVVICENGTDKFRIHAEDVNQTVKFSLNDEMPKPLWARYFYGVLQELKKMRKIASGVDVLFSSDIPTGTGLSSSAALTSAFGYALNTLFDWKLSNLDLALIGQKTEHIYIGVKCGLMDQFASFYGSENQLIMLDCNDYSYEYIPFNSKRMKVVLFDSRVKHSLASSAYNDRRNDCETGLQTLSTLEPNITILRDFDEAILDRHADRLTETVRRRCRFVLQENQRVKQACEYLQNGDIQQFGQAIFASHAGLRDDYEVSCQELDFLVDAARQTPGIIGARMMGGGFGGCTINFVQPDEYEAFIDNVATQFEKKYHKEARWYEVKIGNGTREI